MLQKNGSKLDRSDWFLHDQNKMYLLINYIHKLMKNNDKNDSHIVWEIFSTCLTALVLPVDGAVNLIFIRLLVLNNNNNIIIYKIINGTPEAHLQQCCWQPQIAQINNVHMRNHIFSLC